MEAKGVVFSMDGITIPVDPVAVDDILIMTFYMKRNGRYYFRNANHKLSFKLEKEPSFLVYGQEYQISIS